MSSPTMYKIIYALGSVILAVLAPALLVVLAISEFGVHPALAVTLGIVAVYMWMSVALAAFMVMQHAPNPMPMGPSFTAGFGILTAGFLVVPVVFLPGLVWLYVLPFNERGYFDPGKILSLDEDAFEEPNHGDAA